MRPVTPTSPSPSPEPQAQAHTQAASSSSANSQSQVQGAGTSAEASGALAAGGIAESAAAAAAAAAAATTAPNGGPSHRFDYNYNPVQVPFHEVLPSAMAIDDEELLRALELQDPTEPFRQHVEDSTRNVIDSLYQLAVCAADVQPGREDIIASKVNETISQLASLGTATRSQDEALPLVPGEVLEAVDEGRNPDLWSRNRMARLLSDNQQLAGQRWAIESFRRHLADSVLDEFPELEGTIEQMEEEHRALRTRLDAAADEQGGASTGGGVEGSGGAQSQDLAGAAVKDEMPQQQADIKMEQT